jgi:microcystin-dependent protein
MWYEDFIGEIKLFAGTYSPSGYAFCHGQLMSIAQNTPLFALIGNTYGGDGVSTFALPDLRGRVPMGAGAGEGLTPRRLGEMAGAESAYQQTAAVVAEVQGEEVNSQETVAVVPTQGDPSGSVPTMQPSLAINYIICLNGVWPARD